MIPKKNMRYKLFTEDYFFLFPVTNVIDDLVLDFLFELELDILRDE